MNPNKAVGDRTIRVHARGKLIQPAPLASIGAPRVKIERAGEKPKAPQAPKHPSTQTPKPGAAVALLLFCFLLSAFAAGAALITPPVSGDTGGYYPTRLLWNLAASTTTNRITWDAEDEVFGAEAGLNIRTNGSGRWEWRSASTVLATNTVNRPFGAWRTNGVGAAVYGYTRYEPTALEIVRVNALGEIVSPPNFVNPTTDAANLTGTASVNTTGTANNLAVGATINESDAGAVTNIFRRFQVTVIGDGTTDRRAAIQAQITAAGAVGGGTVILPRGIYRIGDELWLSNNVTLMGDGWPGTIIQHLDSVGVNKRILQMQQITNFMVKGITLDQKWRDRGLAYGNQENDCVGLGYSRDGTFENVRFLDAGKDGINFDESHRIKIIGCIFQDNGSSGFSGHGTNIIATANSFTNCGNGVGWLSPHPGAIGDVSGYQVIYANNTFQDCFIAIHKNGGTAYTISGNTVIDSGNTRTNFFIQGTSRGMINNNVMYGGKMGLYVTNSVVGLDVKGNYFETVAGIYQDLNPLGQQAEMVTYSDNTFYNTLFSGTVAEKRGIEIYGAIAGRTTIKLNKFRTTGSAVYLRTGANGVNVFNNESSGGGTSVILAENNSSSHQIVGNIIPHADATSINIANGTNCHIVGNICGSDLVFTAGSNNFVRFNTFRDINLASGNTRSNTFQFNLVMRNITGSGDYTAQNHWLLNSGTNNALVGVSGVTRPVDSYPNPIHFGDLRGNGLLLTNAHAGLVSSLNAPGTVTGTTAETTLYTATIPAGALGLNGTMEIHYGATANNDASGKTLSFKIGSTQVTAQANLASAASFTGVRTFTCRNSNTAKISGPSSFTLGVPWSSSTLGFLTTAVDTSAATTFTITGTLTDAADTITLEYVQVRIFYAP